MFVAKEAKKKDVRISLYHEAPFEGKVHVGQLMANCRNVPSKKRAKDLACSRTFSIWTKMQMLESAGEKQGHLNVSQRQVLTASASGGITAK